MYLQVMEEYDQKNPMLQEDPMYDMYYYDQGVQPNQYGYDDQMEDEMDGFDSDENMMNGLYMEGLADRIWDEGDEWERGKPKMQFIDRKKVSELMCVVWYLDLRKIIHLDCIDDAGSVRQLFNTDFAYNYKRKS